MYRSKAFGPGAIALLNGTATQVVVSFVKPISVARAAAKAPSKPWPFVGSPSSHGSGLVSLGWKNGGYAGLSAPIVSLPAVLSASLSGAQASADGDGASVGAAVGAAVGATVGVGVAVPPLEHAAASTATRARALRPVVMRMGGCLSSG